MTETVRSTSEERAVSWNAVMASRGVHLAETALIMMPWCGGRSQRVCGDVYAAEVVRATVDNCPKIYNRSKPTLMRMVGAMPATWTPTMTVYLIMALIEFVGALRILETMTETVRLMSGECAQGCQAQNDLRTTIPTVASMNLVKWDLYATCTGWCRVMGKTIAHRF